MTYRGIERIETPRRSRSTSPETPTSKKRKRELYPESPSNRKPADTASENVVERRVNSDEKESSQEAETSEISEYSRVRLRSSRNRWTTPTHSLLFSSCITSDGLGIRLLPTNSLDPGELAASSFIGAQPPIAPGDSENIGYYEVEIIETQSPMFVVALHGRY